MTQEINKNTWLGFSAEQTEEFYDRLLYKLALVEKFQHIVRSSENPSEAMQIGLEEVQRLLAFQVVGIFLVETKENNFQLSEVLPKSESTRLKEAVAEEIHAGTFAWALRQTRPVIVRNQQTGTRVLFYVLNTRSRTLGMFAGILASQDDHAAEDALGLLSLVLLGVTYTLENLALLQELRNYNEHLQELVSQRSAEIVRTNVELNKEITERQHREKELQAAKSAAEAADHAKSEFLAMISHEIRTPMNGVIGFTNLLETSPLNQEQLECVRLLNLSGQQLLCLLNDLLDFSKIEAGQLFLEEHPVNLHDLVYDCIDLSEIRARERNVELSFHVHEHVPFSILADSTRLRQIVMNLMGNALKFTEQGEITLTIDSLKAAAKPTLIWSIQDTGIGIPPDKIEKLFQPFSQADSSTTRKYGGTGLGLAICRKLCELMHGSIWVESEPGVGSCFRFTTVILPDPKLKGTDTNIPFLENQKILVATRHPRQEKMLCNQLQDWGAKTLAPRDDSWQTEKWDLAIIDISVLTDSEEYAKLRERLTHRPILLLASTLKQQEEMKVRAIANWTILHKPVRPLELQQTILTLLGLISPDKIVTPSRKSSTLTKLSLSILLADDSPINQKIGQQMLSKLGHRVTIAENGIQVLDSLRQGQFDAAFLDLEMPELNGYVTARAIRQGEAGEDCRKIFLIAMTAHGTDMRQRCVESGMDDFITKPLSLDQLHKVLLNACH